MDGEVLIVDEHTGRMLAGRRYNDGLHQAIEAKEGVEVREEYQTLATITLQNYFRLYDKLSGMTGTAMTEASEFDKIYSLGVVPIPTNMPMVARGPGRPRLPHRGGEVRRRRRGHRRAAPQGPADPGRHRLGREVRAPVRQAARSAACRTPFSTPSSTPTRRRSSRSPATRARSPSPPTWPAEAPTSCSAARSTSLPTPSCASRVSTRSRPPMSTTPPGRPWSSGSRPRSPPSTTRSRTLGGLYVVGTERHESRRIDNQLRGRSGRQGDPGESRFYLSLRGRADAAVQVRVGRPDPARPARSPTTSRSRTSASPARSPTPRARSSRRTSSPARTSSSTTT